MSTPCLYDYWRSSASYRVRIALNLKEITYETVSVNLMTGEHRASQHLMRNPQGLVPALRIDGIVLTQSLAILQYLDDTRPDFRLFPNDPIKKAKALALCYAIAMETHPVSNLSVAVHAAQLLGTADEGKADWIRFFIAKGLLGFEGLLNAAVKDGYSLDDIASGVGCCLTPQLYNAIRWDVDVSSLTNTLMLEKRFKDLPAFRDAHPDAMIEATNLTRS